MALYRETATGFLCEYASNPGAGYTAISAQPTNTVSNRVTWWRGLDTYGQTTAWHPSEYRSPQDPAEAALSIQVTREAAFISADASGTVTDAYLGANTEVHVYRGTSDVTVSEGWVLTKVDDGCSSTLTQSGGVYTLAITNIPLLATKQGYVRITATRVGVTITKDFRFLKVQQGQDGAPGASAYSMILSNESHTLPANADGTVISFAGAACTATVYLGVAPDTGWSFAGSPASSGTLTYTQSGGTFTITGMAAGTDTAYIDITASKSGQSSITRRFSLAKSKSGKSVSIAATALTRTKTAAGTISPYQIVFTATGVGTSGTPQWYWWYDDQTPFTNTLAIGASSIRLNVDRTNFDEDDNHPSPAESPISGAWDTSKTKISIGVELDGVRDFVTLTQVSDGAPGASAYSMILSNESHTLPAQADGTVTSFAGAVCTATIYLGGSPDTGWSFAGSPASSGTLTYTQSGGTFTITGMAAGTDSAYIDITASKSGQSSITRRFSLTKSKSGKSVSIEATALTRTKTAAGILSPYQIVFTATGVGTSGTPVWYYWYDNQTPFTDTFAAGASVRLNVDRTDVVADDNHPSPVESPIAGCWATSATQMSIGVELDGVRDFVTLTQVSDGATGATGASGQRGSRQILVTTADGVWADLTAWNGIVSQTGTNPVPSDLVTIAKTDGSVATSKFYVSGASPGTWQTPTAYINGSLLVTGTVGANQLAAGSVTTDKLTVGRGGNWLAGSGPTPWAETAYWDVGYNDTGLTATKSAGVAGEYPTAGASVKVSVSGTPASGKLFLLSHANLYPVMAGQKYEISAYLSGGSLSVARVALAFLNSSGTYISEIASADVVVPVASSTLANWARAAAIITAPANATQAYFFAVGVCNGGANPKLCVTQAYFGKAGPNQTEFSDWSPSGVLTQIDGSGIKTATITADRLVAGTITAASGVIGSLDASKITTGTLSANYISGGTINGSNVTITNLNASNITGGTLSANYISGGTINGSNITVTNLNATNITTGTLNVDGRIASGSITESAGNSYPQYNLGIAANGGYRDLWTPNQAAVAYTRRSMIMSGHVDVQCNVSNAVLNVTLYINGSPVADFEYDSGPNNERLFIPLAYIDNSITTAARTYLWRLTNSSSGTMTIRNGSVFWMIMRK